MLDYYSFLIIPHMIDQGLNFRKYRKINEKKNNELLRRCGLLFFRVTNICNVIILWIYNHLGTSFVSNIALKCRCNNMPRYYFKRSKKRSFIFSIFLSRIVIWCIFSGVISFESFPLSINHFLRLNFFSWFSK